MSDAATASIGSAAGVRELLTVVFKYKVAIIATFLGVVLAVTAGTLLMSPTYQASARILVKFGRENVYRSEVGDVRNQVVASNTEEILNSEVSILTSRDLITQVVSAMTVDVLYPDLVTNPPGRGTPLEAAVKQFSDNLTVGAVRKSSIIEIALQHKDPGVAAKALQLLLEDFKEKHLQAYSDPQSSYLEKQLASYAERLTATQRQLQTYKQEHGVFSLEEQRTLLLQQRNNLDVAYKTAQSRINELRHGVASLKQQLQAVAQDVPLSTENERYRSIDDAKNQLLTLQLREQDLLRLYTERNQLVVGVREEMRLVRAFITQQETDIKSRVRTGQNVVYQELQTDLLRLQTELPSQEAKAAVLRGQIDQLDIQIPALDETENGLENLKRELAVNDRNYRAYQERVEEARTLEDLNKQKSANISVIEAASTSVDPIKPRKGLNIGVAVILGVLAGLAVAFARELSSQTLSTPESVERRLGIPVLATIVVKRRRQVPS
jgi:uncharacterized protein involved in exopolysaccharide biosynthesis